jgi:hypothetical protein
VPDMPEPAGPGDEPESCPELPTGDNPEPDGPDNPEPGGPDNPEPGGPDNPEPDGPDNPESGARDERAPDPDSLPASGDANRAPGCRTDGILLPEVGAGTSGVQWAFECDLEGLLAAAGRTPDAAGYADQEEILAAEREARDSGNAAPVDVTGLVAENLPGGPGLAAWLSQLPAGQLADRDLPGAAAAFRRVASWAQAAELAVVAQIAVRSAARDDRTGLTGDGRPAQVTRDAAAQVSLGLTLSPVGASAWTTLAVTLQWRMPATAAALACGGLDLYRARVIAEGVARLSDEAARIVEDQVLPVAGDLTYGQLHAAVRRAVIAADPEGAEHRREASERQARLSLYPDEDHTATLAGSRLPAVHAAAAMARVSAMARALKASGAGGGTDFLRAHVFLGLLLGTLPVIPPPSGGPPDADPPPDDGEPPESEPPQNEPPESEPPENEPPENEPPENGRPETEPPETHLPPAPRPRGSADPNAGPPGRRSPHPGGSGSSSRRGGSGSRSPAPQNSGSRSPAPGKREPARPNLAGTVDRHPNNVSARSLDDDAGPEAQGNGETPNANATGPPGNDGIDDWRDGVPEPSDADAPPDDGFREPPSTERCDDAGRFWGDPLEDHYANTNPVPAWPVVPVTVPAPPMGATEAIATGRPPPGLLDLSVPWTTLTCESAMPAALGRVGPITARQARKLAQAAVTDHATQWRIILTDQQGQATATTRLSKIYPPPGLDQPGRTGLIGRVTVTIPAAAVDDAPAIDRRGGGILTDILRAAARAEAAARQLARINQDAPGGCAHTTASAAYRPPSRIREFVIARDLTCRYPFCGQPAWRGDLDHTRAWHKGGLTCSCNLGPLCRSHHILKQLLGWTLTQPQPGVFAWTTPAGCTYIVRPDTQQG